MERRTLSGGRYELIAEIGRGGMASVWRGRDTRLGVDRAIKLLDRPSTQRRTAAARERFDREARIMARLEHPNVVPVHDAGEDDGQLWIVMSLVEGGSVADKLARDGPMEVGEAVAITAAVLEALGAAHALGIVHRDVKPHNVLLDGRGVPRLADFGIASAEGEGGPTRTGAVLGTWTYMAPEQRVDAKRTDARSDLYAVGVLLVALILGRDPADLHDPDRTDTVIGALPARLRPFVRRCTRFQPEDRYATAEEALAALRAAADGPEPLPAVRPGWRRWVPVAVAGAVLVGLAVGGIGTVGVAGLAWTQFGPREPGATVAQVDTAAEEPAPEPAPAPTPEPEPAPAPDPEPERVVAPAPRTPPVAPDPAPAPPAEPVTPVRLSVNGAAHEFEVLRGDQRLAADVTPWSGELPAGVLQLLLKRDGQVVQRRTWNTAATRTLCLEADTWEPCAH